MIYSPARYAIAAVIVACLCIAAEGQASPQGVASAAGQEANSPAFSGTVGAAGDSDPEVKPRSTAAGAAGNSRNFPPPLTGKERWDKYVRDTYTGFPIYAASLGAALGDQSRNVPNQWGKTWEGYGKRVGTQYASFAIQTSVYAGGSALLKNEGRYVACQCSGGWRRAAYAFQMSFFTYHDRKKVIDVPQFAAAYAAGIIPVLWYPQGYSVSAQGVQNGTYQLGFVVLVREIQEFSPELKRVFGRLKR